MSRSLLDTYARLLTTDTRACANLFAHDAEYLTRLGSHDLHFKGRNEIRRFLQHVPRQIVFRATSCAPEGANFMGAVRMSAADLRTRHQHVRYSVEGGRFRRFEILNSA